MELITEAMKICAVNVREIPCARCFNLEACRRNNGIPVSNLGRYLAFLHLEALPAIEEEMLGYAGHEIYLKAFLPNDKELDAGAFVVIRVFEKRDNHRHLDCRIPLIEELSEQSISAMVYEAYYKAKGII